MTRPLRILAAHRLPGAAMLLAATIVALISANSRWADNYHTLLATPVSIGVGTFELSKRVILSIDDTLMGIFSFSWLAVRIGQFGLPTSVSWRQLHGVAVLCGIGFTMSLFIGSLAFAGTSLDAVAKVEILLGSAASALAGLAPVVSSPARPPEQMS